MKTAECVTPRHPDKMCDQISDAILDFCLSQDPDSRVAVEVLGGHGEVVIMGEVTTKASLQPFNVKGIVRDIVGYDIETRMNIEAQSPEIAQGVDTGGAGDQGIMRGYATRATESFMPLEYHLARDLAQFLFNEIPFDGKTQVTIDDQNRVVTLVASFQNSESKRLEDLMRLWTVEHDVARIEGYSVFANPAGDWSQGGFDADTGLTGRKLAVDNYGPSYPIGGGAFSGKDPSKVDRSGAYMARKIAVDLLKEDDHWQEATVELAYAIGIAQPVEATARLTNGQEYTVVDIASRYDLTPAGIIKALDLKRPQYQETACWGHFGNGFTWDL